MITFKDISRDQWDTLITKFPEANMLQSWQWGEVQEQLGHTVVRQEIADDTTTVGLVSAIIKDARRGRYLEIPGGPLIDWSNATLVGQVLASLKQIGSDHSCVFMRLRPQCEDSPELRNLFAKFGAQLSPMHVTADHTSIIDLAPDDETLLTNMRQQTRYEIKRAPKRGVEIVRVEAPEIIETFYHLQAETAERQGFIPPSRKYLEACFEKFGDNAAIYKASKGDVLLNLALVITYGQEVAYLEAASTSEARREPGAYAVIWQAMRDAKSAGITRFNLWGIAPPDSPGHRYAGVTTFKRGFGGRDVAYLSPHDIVLKPVRYQITKLIETSRKKRRHL